MSHMVCATCWHWAHDEHPSPALGYCGGITVEGQSGAQKFGYSALPVTDADFGCAAYTFTNPEEGHDELEPDADHQTPADGHGGQDVPRPGNGPGPVGGVGSRVVGDGPPVRGGQRSGGGNETAGAVPAEGADDWAVTLVDGLVDLLRSGVDEVGRVARTAIRDWR